VSDGGRGTSDTAKAKGNGLESMEAYLEPAGITADGYLAVDWHQKPASPPESI
jgi:hypothetical protein